MSAFVSTASTLFSMAVTCDAVLSLRAVTCVWVLSFRAVTAKPRKAVDDANRVPATVIS